MSPSAVSVSGVSAAYNGEPALREVSFEAERGQMVGVLGPNGGGKTTLFRVLAGELAPASGEAWVAGRTAYLAQGESARLDFPVSAADVALMGALAHGRWWLPAGRAERSASRTALERVALGERAGVAFGELSGGERRRALLARALVQDAPVLLLDEPLSGVDPASAQVIASLFSELCAEGRTLLVATHDVESARRCDLVLCVNVRQVAFGPPERVLDRATLEATYGRELIVLEDGERTRAVTVQHHEHAG